jgi:glycosyltransferase involved in cell wall biosynthesis
MALDSDGTSLPLITIIIPAYNAARFLERTLKSAAEQSHANLQILVVDDGSADTTAAIAKAAAAADPRIELFSKQNQGLSAARNDGIRRARGEYVAFLDADDIWHREKLARQLAAILLSPAPDLCVAAYALSRYVDENDAVTGDYPLWNVHGRVLERHLVYNFIGTGGSNLLCRREAALAVGGFDTSYQAAEAGLSEDYDFQLKLAARYHIAAVPEYLVGYRRYAGTMSRNRRRMLRSHRAVIEHHLALNEVSPACRRWATGVIYATECGSHIQAMNLPGALAAGLQLLGVDPMRLFAEVFNRVPRAVVARLMAGASSRPDGPPKFQDLDPSVADPKPFAPLTLRRLEYLRRQDERHDVPAA